MSPDVLKCPCSPPLILLHAARTCPPADAIIVSLPSCFFIIVFITIELLPPSPAIIVSLPCLWPKFLGSQFNLPSLHHLNQNFRARTRQYSSTSLASLFITILPMIILLHQMYKLQHQMYIVHTGSTHRIRTIVDLNVGHTGCWIVRTVC